METNRYLSCQAKSTKRYKSPLLLTEQGQAVGKKIADKINGVLDEISESLEAVSKNGESRMESAHRHDSAADWSDEHDQTAD